MGINTAYPYSSMDPLRVRIETHQRFSRIGHDVNQVVLTHLEPFDVTSMLDVGCGTSTFLRDVAAAWPAVTRRLGVDVSPGALAALRRSDSAAGCFGSILHLPLADNIFDATTARHMLYHIDDVHGALTELARVTRAGGPVIVTVNHGEALPRITEVTKTAVVQCDPDDIPVALKSSTTESLPEQLSAVFAESSVTRYDDELVCETPEPVVAYCISILDLYGIGASHPQRGRCEALIGEAVTDYFRTASTWVDPKGFAVGVGTTA